MLKLISGDIEDFYELVDMGQYSEQMGLDLGVESGIWDSHVNRNEKGRKR